MSFLASFPKPSFQFNGMARETTLTRQYLKRNIVILQPSRTLFQLTLLLEGRKTDQSLGEFQLISFDSRISVDISRGLGKQMCGRKPSILHWLCHKVELRNAVLETNCYPNPEAVPL